MGEGGRTRPRPRPTLQRLSVGHSVGAAAQWLAAGGLLGVGRVEMAITGSAADSVIRFHRCSLLMLIFFLRKFSVDTVRRRPCPNSRPQPRGEWSRETKERERERESRLPRPSPLSSCLFLAKLQWRATAAILRTNERWLLAPKLHVPTTQNT